MNKLQIDLTTTKPCCPTPLAWPAKPHVLFPRLLSVSKAQSWTCGKITTAAGDVFRVSTKLSRAERFNMIKCRISGFRMSYVVQPGLYAVGNPDAASDVFASANYKLSFDILRRALAGMNAWILVLDTKGINVWCAAGKGSFGTDELVHRIGLVQLHRIVSHRKIILPQLAAPGINAAEVLKRNGFSIRFGPVRAEDIPAYVQSGYAATRAMRTVRFSIADRLVLTPMEIIPAAKQFPVFALMVLLVFGAQPTGIIFSDAWSGGWPILALGLAALLAGAFITPLFLPIMPFRSFAIKGWVVGLFITFAAMKTIHPYSEQHILVAAASYLAFPLVSSYLALQFTGATTFTGMSGVKKELTLAIPLYIAGCVISACFIFAYKLVQWGVI